MLGFFKSGKQFSRAMTSKIDDQKFMAVISIPKNSSPEIKINIKKQLIAKGYLCMDYLGDQTKIAVGFDKNTFVHEMEDAIKKAETSGDEDKPESKIKP